MLLTVLWLTIFSSACSYFFALTWLRRLHETSLGVQLGKLLGVCVSWWWVDKKLIKCSYHCLQTVLAAFCYELLWELFVYLTLFRVNLLFSSEFPKLFSTIKTSFWIREFHTIRFLVVTRFEWRFYIYEMLTGCGVETFFRRRSESAKIQEAAKLKVFSHNSVTVHSFSFFLSDSYSA